jgi:thymidylate kinase
MNIFPPNDPFPIVGIEGPAFSGKTSLLGLLKERFTNEVAVIPEGTEYIDRNNNASEFPLDLSPEGKKGVHFCIEVEKARCEDALKEQRKGRLVFMDRSIISNFVFYLLVNKTNTADKEMKDFLPYATAAFKQALINKNLFFPSRIVFITISDQATFIERLKRGGHSNVFNQWEAVGLQNDIYANLLPGLYPNSQVKRVVSLSGRQNIEAIGAEAFQFAKSMPNDKHPRVAEIESLFDNTELMELWKSNKFISKIDTMAATEGSRLAFGYISSVKNGIHSK